MTAPSTGTALNTSEALDWLMRVHDSDPSQERLRIVRHALLDAADERDALRALAAEAIASVGSSHNHWREGGIRGRCGTCDEADGLREDLRDRLAALATDTTTEDS